MQNCRNMIRSRFGAIFIFFNCATQSISLLEINSLNRQFGPVLLSFALAPKLKKRARGTKKIRSLSYIRICLAENVHNNLISVQNQQIVVSDLTKNLTLSPMTI